MLKAPPAHMKSSFLELLEPYVGVVIVSDINSRTLNSLRDDMCAGKISTLVVPDWQKLYERKGETSSNVEGHIRAMVEEGFTHASWEDPSMRQSKARALVLSGMPQGMYRRHFEGWKETGFLRRFMWVDYVLKNPYAIMDAIQAWERLEIQDGLRFGIPSSSIKYSLNAREVAIIRNWLRYQHGQELPFILLQKIACVLRWRSIRTRRPDNTMSVLADFAESLEENGTEVDV